MQANEAATGVPVERLMSRYPVLRLDIDSRRLRSQASRAGKRKSALNALGRIRIMRAASGPP